MHYAYFLRPIFLIIYFCWWADHCFALKKCFEGNPPLDIIPIWGNTSSLQNICQMPQNFQPLFQKTLPPHCSPVLQFDRADYLQNPEVEKVHFRAKILWMHSHLTHPIYWWLQEKYTSIIAVGRSDKGLIVAFMLCFDMVLSSCSSERTQAIASSR